MLYLQLAFGDPLFFAHDQKAWCEVSERCGLTFPFKSLFVYGNLLLKGTETVGLNSPFLDWFFSIFFLGSLYFVYKHLPKNYFFYSIFVLLLPLSSGSSVGMTRYVLQAFPIIMVMPLIFRFPIIQYLIILIFFLIQLRLITLFTNGWWVA